MADTHYSNLQSKFETRYDTFPTEPEDGQAFIDNKNNRMCIYNASTRQWYFGNLTTTTSTSTSSTSTSTSTTSTSSSTSSSTSTSTSSSTSTTTTL